MASGGHISVFFYSREQKLTDSKALEYLQDIRDLSHDLSA